MLIISTSADYLFLITNAKMRSYHLLSAGISCLLAFAQASSIPAKDVVVSRDVQFVSSDADIAPRNWTHYNTTSISTVGQLDASVPQTAVVIAVLYTNAQIVQGVCTATAATGPGGVAVCGVVAIAAVLTSFFSLFRASSGPAGDSPVRSLTAPSFTIHDALLPADACDTICQFKANAANATFWASVGNTTVDGIFHDIHFSQNGKILGLRAVPSPSGNTKRDDTYDDNGVVAAYFWQDDHQTA